MIVNPLICVLSPRNITLVKEGHNTFKDVPHLWIKYLKAYQAYRILTDYFMKNQEYTHLVISPDDLIVKREHYEALVKDLEQEDYPVLGGVCNVDVIHENLLAITVNSKPHVIRRIRFVQPTPDGYAWVTRDEVEGKGIIEVQFAGMPFLFIRRDIVEQIPLKGDTPYDPNPLVRATMPHAFDCAFCWECRARKIPIHVDTRVRMLHLNGTGLRDQIGHEVNNHYVYRRAPMVYFQQGDKVKDLTKKYLKLIWEQNEYTTRDNLRRFMK